MQEFIRSTAVRIGTGPDDIRSAEALALSWPNTLPGCFHVDPNLSPMNSCRLQLSGVDLSDESLEQGERQLAT
ncbi:hypothetical protein [Ferribacterium limneticum]|uniref:hypothetical protein n=1 Tax=Ferribacterium limneticum TaxID=76259 RepID=UPI001CF96D63|nr:hypothetical protein [Ferribacterium limneticum]UCV17737.1 hypothetical protein KI610_13015 [Ferribacterium limneticum]